MGKFVQKENWVLLINIQGIFMLKLSFKDT